MMNVGVTISCRNSMDAHARASASDVLSTDTRREREDRPVAQQLMRSGLDEWRRARRRQEITAYARQDRSLRGGMFDATGGAPSEVLPMTYSVSRFSTLMLAVLAACVTSAGDPADERETSAAVTARGSRVLAMDVGPGPGETREAAVAKAQAAGVTTVVLNYDWSELEPTAFQYQNARLIADNAFYSASPHAMSVVLNIRPIAGACRVVPPDLATLAWSDPVMTTRFGYLLSWIRGYLPDITVQVMSIGTEIDSHLAPADYVAYKVFFEAARSNAKSQWGAGLSVGTAVTWGSLTTPGPEQAAILDLDEHADHVLTTYYGINADLTVKDPYAGPVADVYAALLAVDGNAKTRGHTIDLIEVGYLPGVLADARLSHQRHAEHRQAGVHADCHRGLRARLVTSHRSRAQSPSPSSAPIGGPSGGAAGGAASCLGSF
jgi:hypothetical protein